MAMPESALEHVPVIDKSVRQDGTFARENFRYDHGTDTYAWPGREDPDHDRHTLVNGPHHPLRGRQRMAARSAQSSSCAAT